MTIAPHRVNVADPTLVLAELVARLRHAGLPLPMDRVSLTAAHGHVVGLLGALGLSVNGEVVLAEADWLLLRCAAAPRQASGLSSAQAESRR